MKAPSHDRLAHMADDVTQLVKPIHIAVRGRIVTHPALLDQLRAACVPGNSQRGPERRRIPDSRPPLRLDAVDLLSGVYVGMAGWHAKLDLPSPSAFVHGCHHGSCQGILVNHRGTLGPTCSTASLELVDWHKAVLRQLVGAAPTLAPSIADWLAADVQSWWHDAAVGSGWRPDDLRRLR